MGRKKNSDSRRERREVLRLYKKGRIHTKQGYVDNAGMVWENRHLSRFFSLFHFVSGCLKNGFPIVVGRLWYTAWAFYPFFFIRSDNKNVHSLNHERIHIRQQRDLHMAVSLPLTLFLLFLHFLYGISCLKGLLLIPFVPQIFYFLELLRVFFRSMRRGGFFGVTLSELRRDTCYEKEAEENASDLQYLLRRKFLAVWKYRK